MRKSGETVPCFGFTLIELSIVLVIIGLIIGGVLVGRDLIRAAAVRGTITQVEKYNTAVNAFRIKYNALPGDISALRAAQFGMISRAGTKGQGNEDFAIESGHAGGNYICGEVALFWNDLSTARLIEGTFSGVDGNSAGGTCGTAADIIALQSILPGSVLDKRAFFTAYTDAGRSYYQLVGGINSLDNFGHLIGESETAVAPRDGYAIDSKIDDGMPLSGTITARNVNFYYDTLNTPPCATPSYTVTCAPGTSTPAAPSNGVCVSNAAGNPYNNGTGAEVLGCSLRFIFN